MSKSNMFSGNRFSGISDQIQNELYERELNDICLNFKASNFVEKLITFLSLELF